MNHRSNAVCLQTTDGFLFFAVKGAQALFSGHYYQRVVSTVHLQDCLCSSNQTNYFMKKTILFIVAFVVLTLNAQSQQPRSFRFFADPTNPDAHDPVMARCDGRYYLFTTGIGCLTSTDLLNWQQGPRVMPVAPQWTSDAVPGFRGDCWAPDILYHEGLWYMYYSCSTFGKNGSAIGLMTNRTLNPESPDYKWEDQGMVVRSEQGKTNWNAIDPNVAVDEKGRPWLVWGSFWDGIQMVQLDKKDFRTLKGHPKTVARRYMRNSKSQLVSEEDLKRASEAPDAGANAIEAPFIIHEGGYYYLFASWDYCCKGVNSNYKTVVGRSRRIQGPYLDREGKDMAEGGGGIVAQRDEQFYGIGHNAAYKFDGNWIFIAHGYSRMDNGASKLVVRRMTFDADGWPVLGERIQRDPLAGKTFNVIGDSYVANHRRDKAETWHAKLAAHHAMPYNNYGRNGGCVAFDRTSERFGPSLVDRYAAMDSSADIVLIVAGHNDAVKIGNSADSLLIFERQLDSLLVGISRHCPKAQIGYVTPWYIDIPGFASVVASIHKVCDRHGVPVLDNYSDRSVIKVRDDDFRRRYFQSANDNAHLNAAGHDLFLATGETFVRRLAVMTEMKAHQ